MTRMLNSSSIQAIRTSTDDPVPAEIRETSIGVLAGDADQLRDLRKHSIRDIRLKKWVGAIEKLQERMEQMSMLVARDKIA